MSPALRPARTSDVAAVTALEVELFGPDAWSSASVAEELTGERRRAVVAEHEGRLTGYAVTALAGDVVDLERIGVASAYQRAGVARALLREVRRQAGADGAARMLLEVGEANTAAVRLYTRAGFRPIDRRAGYYRDGGDALVMEAPAREEEP